MKSHYLWLAAILLLTSCNVGTRTPVQRGIYHWKTSSNPTNWEKQWMKDHEVGRLYIKLFDVDAGQKHSFPDWKMVPVATTQFKQKLPDDVEIVPVVYITTDAIHALVDVDDYYSSTSTYANLIVKRIDDMMKENWNGTLREVQLDCDWTASTRDAYYKLCKEVKKCMDKDWLLSSTIRLHQLQQAPPPVDYGVLMVYNTGDATKIDVEKPILDINDVTPYLKHLKSYDLKMVSAYPIYKWDIVFRNGKFVDIMHEEGEVPMLETDTIVSREPTLQDILECKKAVGKSKPDCLNEIILFDLNNYNINRYKTIDYEEIFD